MAATNPSSSYKLQSLIAMICRNRVATPYNLRHANSFDQGLRFLCVTSGQFPKMEMGKNGESKAVQSPSPAPPPKFGIFDWMRLFLGSISTLLLPVIWTNNMLTLEGKAERIAEEVEVAAVVVEKVATTADMVFSEVEKRLPDDSKLKEVAQAMERGSSLAAHEAQLVEDIIHKVGDVKQDLEELDTMVEKVVKGINTPKTK